MGAVAEAMLAVFDSNTEITWTTTGMSVALASFTHGAAKATTTFSQVTEAEWQADFDVVADRQSAIEMMQSSPGKGRF